MAGSLTNIGEELMLNLVFRSTGVQPTNIYVGLATNNSSTNALVEESIIDGWRWRYHNNLCFFSR